MCGPNFSNDRILGKTVKRIPLYFFFFLILIDQEVHHSHSAVPRGFDAVIHDSRNTKNLLNLSDRL